MGFFATITSFSSIFNFFSGRQPPPKPTTTPKKRRADDTPSSESKVRRLDEANHFGGRFGKEPAHRTNQGEAYFMPRNRAKLGEVHISKWGRNGKENHVQYLPPFNTVNNSTMGHCVKGSMDEIQVLEDNHRSSNISKRGRNSLNVAGVPCYDIDNRNGSDAEIVEVPPPTQSSYSKRELEVVKIAQSPHSRSGIDNDVQIVKEHASASKQGRSYKDTPFARKPFKAIGTTVQASSTPIVFTSRRSLVHSPEQPEIEILPSSSLTNGMDSCRYRSQSSILSSDSNSSRKNSTLLHMKRAEDSERYEKIFMKFQSDKLFSPAAQTSNVSRYQDPSGAEALNPRSDLCRYRSHLNSPMDDRALRGLNKSCTVKDAVLHERLNVPVEKVHVNEPSTSASRHQSDDAELQYLGQVHTHPVHKTGELYENALDEIIKKYNRLKEEKLKQVLKEEETCKLYEERNRLIALDRSKKVKEDLHEQINAYLRITEEPEIEEEEEKIPPLPELTDEMNAEINKALAAPPDAVLASAFNLTIKGRDMRTLKDLAWLNDEVINFYMNMIIERGKSDKYPAVHAFNTFFFPKLISSGYDTLKRWTKKVDVFAHDYLLVPVHRGMHWCMAIIDMKEKVIRYYDSMDGHFPQCMDALLNYLQKESLDKKKQPFDTTGWVKEHAEGIPQQNNGSDCGMFACMFAEYVSRGVPITFTQENMPYFRRKAVYEILKAKLLC